VLRIYAPDGSRKPFLLKCYFSEAVNATSGSALLLFRKKHFCKKLEADSRIKAQIFFKPAAKLKKITRNSRRFPGYCNKF